MTSIPHGLAGPLSQKKDPKAFGSPDWYCVEVCEVIGVWPDTFGSYCVPIDMTVSADAAVSYCHSRGLGVPEQFSVQLGPAGRYDAHCGCATGVVPDGRVHMASATSSPVARPDTST